MPSLWVCKGYDVSIVPTMLAVLADMLVDNVHLNPKCCLTPKINATKLNIPHISPRCLAELQGHLSGGLSSKVFIGRELLIPEDMCSVARSTNCRPCFRFMMIPSPCNASIMGTALISWEMSILHGCATLIGPMVA